MKLVDMKEILINARKYHYAVGGFNIVNMETVQAIVRAAEIEKTPIIVQIYHGDLAHAGGGYIKVMTEKAAESASVPVALQLDHGQSFDQAMSCIKDGFSSVMIDLSSSDYHKNVEDTRRLVQEAHAKEISVEAELGEIHDAYESVEKRNSGLTDPEVALKFVEETGVDALAVSIGTAHGIYSSRPVIDFALLKKITETIKIPIVVHGGSNTPDEDILEIIRFGVSKINIGTDLMNAFTNGIKEALSAKKDVAPRDYLGHARACVEKEARKKIQLLNRLRIWE